MVEFIYKNDYLIVLGRMIRLEEKQFEQFQYMEIENEITIIKYLGEEAVVNVPFMIDQLPVTSIGHSAFRDCKFITKIILPDSICQLGPYSFCKCTGLTEFYFGDQVKEIGSHAFYNCWGLYKVFIPGDIREIADGAFKNCDKLRQLNVRSTSENVVSIKHTLEDLSQDVEIKIIYHIDGLEEKAELFFPKDTVFYSDYTNRLNDKTTFGVGNQYHHCVGDGTVDYLRYDFLFARAQNELQDDMLCNIALLRLMSPFRLTEEYREKYLEFIKIHILLVSKLAIKEENMEQLEFLSSEKMIEKENMEDILEYAHKLNKVECVSFLLAYKNKNFSKREITFDL